MLIQLKLAILQSHQTQRQISAETRITEPRLSSIVRGWADPHPDERAALTRVLNVGPKVFQADHSAQSRDVR